MNSLSDYNPNFSGNSSAKNWWDVLPPNTSDVNVGRYPRIRYQTEMSLAAPPKITGTSSNKIFERPRLRTGPTDMDTFQIQEIELSEAEAEELDRLSRETRENGVSWDSLKVKLGL